MPIPGEKETQTEFHTRCMAHEHTQKWEPKQRNAVCYALWADAHPQSAEAKRESITVQRESETPLVFSETGEISGYAATWAFNKDGIQFERGSFAKTLTERAGKIPITVRHTITGSNVLETVGFIIRGIEDEVGLLITGEFLNTPLAQEMRRRAKIGAIRGMSIFAPVLNYNLINGIKHATEAMLQDVCLTNTPLDANATVLASRAEPPAPEGAAGTPPAGAPPTPPVQTIAQPVVDTQVDVIRRASLIEVQKRKVESNARQRVGH